jgi:hypothetical protein
MGFRIAFTQFILLFTIETVYVVFEFIYSTKGFILSNFFIPLVIYFSGMINISSIISLIAYRSKITSLQIDKLSDNVLSKDLPEI